MTVCRRRWGAGLGRRWRCDERPSDDIRGEVEGAVVGDEGRADAVGFQRDALRLEAAAACGVEIAGCDDPDALEAGVVEGVAAVSRRQATALNPFFATSVSSFNDAPRGRFSPRSHWLTKPVVTLR